MPEVDDGLSGEAKEVMDSTPGVHASAGDDQILMEESSDHEQTPAAVNEPAPAGISLEELQALKADLENARKRMLKEQTRTVEYATKELVKRLLPVIDHFHLAIDHGEAGDGVQLAFKELIEVLSVEGLEEIETNPGDAFDPAVHHALTTMPDPEVSEERVGQIHRRGYRFKEHILRAPEVVVSQPTERESG